LVPELLAMHRTGFPEHDFVLERFQSNALLPPDRDGLVVHQWVVVIDGAPSGFLLFDTNVSRRIGVSHYVYLDATASRVAVDGRRLLDWLYRLVVLQVEHDVGGGSLGCVGEASDDRVRLFEWFGMRRLDVEYYEPSTGYRWHGPGTPIKRMNLMWRPPDGVDPGSLEPEAARAGSAAFLLDHYGFQADLDWVRAAVGGER
jgi:hypothetical protein